MLVQSLPFNSTIKGLSDLAASLRSEGVDLGQMKVSVSALTYDLMKAIGMPENALRLVLTESELVTLGHDFENEDTGYVVKCQFCGEEALTVATYRGESVLVCEDCAAKRCK